MDFFNDFSIFESDNFPIVRFSKWINFILLITLIISFLYTEKQVIFKNDNKKEQVTNEEMEVQDDVKNNLDNNEEMEIQDNNNDLDNEDEIETKISESSDSEEDLDRSEGKIISKHFKVLNTLNESTFENKIYDYSSSFKFSECEIYPSKHFLKMEICFCNLCGNYICYNTSECSNKVICWHYILFDCVEPIIGNISGHILSTNEKKVYQLIDNIYKDDENKETYKSELSNLIISIN